MNTPTQEQLYKRKELKAKRNARAMKGYRAERLDGKKLIQISNSTLLVVEEGHYKEVTVDGKDFILKEWKPGEWQAHEITTNEDNPW